MKVGKPKSKRVPVRRRHKIEKASAAKQRKQRKIAKKNPQWRSRLKKDPGVPNLFPYKGEILAEMEESKMKKEEEQMRKRELAKARRRAQADVDAVVGVVREAARGDEEAMEPGEVVVADETAEMDVDQETANPMAALLASASARARAYAPVDDEDLDDDDESDEQTDGELDRVQSSTMPPVNKDHALPRKAIEDPIRTVTLLIEQMKTTTDGIRCMMDHFQMRPLVTVGSGFSTSYLVEVARKRGRLGKGGVPNLHSAALAVLGDVHDGRMVLPAISPATVTKIESSSKGDVRVVSHKSEPFRIEGLWENEAEGEVDERGHGSFLGGSKMVIER